jgi:hypothetical protein
MPRFFCCYADKHKYIKGNMLSAITNNNQQYGNLNNDDDEDEKNNVFVIDDNDQNDDANDPVIELVNEPQINNNITAPVTITEAFKKKTKHKLSQQKKYKIIFNKINEQKSLALTTLDNDNVIDKMTLDQLTLFGQNINTLILLLNSDNYVRFSPRVALTKQVKYLQTLVVWLDQKILLKRSIDDYKSLINAITNNINAGANIEQNIEQNQYENVEENIILYVSILTDLEEKMKRLDKNTLSSVDVIKDHLINIKNIIRILKNYKSTQRVTPVGSTTIHINNLQILQKWFKKRLKLYIVMNKVEKQELKSNGVLNELIDDCISCGAENNKWSFTITKCGHTTWCKACSNKIGTHCVMKWCPQYKRVLVDQ